MQHTFVHFFPVFARLARETQRDVYEKRKHAATNFPSLSELMTVRYKILGNHFFPTYIHTFDCVSLYSAFRAQFPDMCKRLSEFVAYRLSLSKTSKLIFSDFLTSESLLVVRKVYRWDFCTGRCRLLVKI